MFPVICLLFLSDEKLPNLFYMIDFAKLGNIQGSIRYSLSNIIRNPVVSLPNQNDKRASSFIGSNVLMHVESSEKTPDKYGSLNTSNVTGNSTIYFKLTEYKTELLFILYGKALLAMEKYPSIALEQSDKLFVFATASVQNNSINCKILFKKEEVEWYRMQKGKIIDILREEDFLNTINHDKTESWFVRMSEWSVCRFLVNKEYVISMGFVSGLTGMLYLILIARWVKLYVFISQPEQPIK
eukprot:GAHX01000359.1.p1 GENE.GAHX01000359.1~~GAHX01000359.1.p1  ORF type:complete len:241 (-),score=29.86 GAHX01000359.1:128-850(-)